MESKISKTLLTAVPAALAAGAGTAMYLRYRRDRKAAEARVSSGSRMIDTPGGPIEFADTLPQGTQKAAHLGDPADRSPSSTTSAQSGSPGLAHSADIGKETPVLVIHGAGGGFDQGLDLARPLIESGFRVIAPSRFGYLGTPLPEDASPMAQADAHARLLDALEIGKAAVVAFSAGAPSAMQLCLRHPGRCPALVLAVPLAWSPRPDGAAEEAPAETSAVKEFLLNTMLSSDFAYWALRKLARKTMIRTVLGTPPEEVEHADAEEQARADEILAHIEPISRRKKGLENEARIVRSLGRYDLERLEVPTLVIGVENCLYNTYAGARYTAEHIPGARFVGYAEGGHLVVGHQTECWQEVLEFLAAAAERAKEQLVASR